jgi:hypothetical protein
MISDCEATPACVREEKPAPHDKQAKELSKGLDRSLERDENTMSAIALGRHR